MASCEQPLVTRKSRETQVRKKQGKQNNCDPASKITLNPASFAKQKQSATAATV
jgi:hypothetical protein